MTACAMRGSRLTRRFCRPAASARPVALTVVTAIFGVLPIAFGVNLDFLTREVVVGALATQWWISLSTAIVFGLGFATILTLLVTPAALMMIANMAEWRKRRKE